MFKGFSGGSDGKESVCNAADPGSILGWEDPLEKRNGYPLHYSCLENLMYRRAWWATVHAVLDPTERLTHTDTHCVHTGKWRWKGSWLTHKVIFEALKSKDHPW